MQVLFPYPLLPGGWCCRSHPPLGGVVSPIPLQRCCFPPFSFWLASLPSFLSPSPWSWCCSGASALDVSFRFFYFLILFSCLRFFFRVMFPLVCAVMFFLLPMFLPFRLYFSVSFTVHIFIIMNIFIFLFVCSFIFWTGEGRGGIAISRTVALSGVPLFWSKTAGGDTIAWVVFDFTEPRVIVRTLDRSLSHNTHGELRGGSHQVRCRCVGVRAAFWGPLYKFPTHLEQRFHLFPIRCQR